MQSHKAQQNQPLVNQVGPETLALKWHGSLRESQYTHVLVTEDTFKHRSVFSGETTLMLQVLLVPVKRSKVELLVPVKRSKVELLVPVKGQKVELLASVKRLKVELQFSILILQSKLEYQHRELKLVQCSSQVQ